MVTYIYALIDPRTSQCRYVGKADNLNRRLQRHMQQGRLADKTHKATWLRSLRSAGFYPEIVELEQVSKEEWVEAEQFWVAYFLGLGFDLTNGTRGGDGGSFKGETNPMFGRRGADHPSFGKPRAQDVRDRIRSAQLGKPKVLSVEALAKVQALGKAQVGANNPFFGRVHSEETKKHWSETRKGTLPPCTRLFTIDGETKTLRDWSAISEVAYGTITNRLRCGWDVRTAILTPLTKQKGVIKKRVWSKKKQTAKIDIAHIYATPEEHRIYQVLKEKGRLQDAVLDLLKEGR